MQGDARRWRRKREADNGIFALLALSLEACVVPNDIADALLLASMAITISYGVTLGPSSTVSSP
jgi:hypothetical protein